MSVHDGDSRHDDLGRLLAPVTRERFLSDYWERVPLFLKGPGRFPRDLFDMSKLQAAICGHDGVLLTASADRGAHHARIGGEDMDAFFRAGATVCATFLERADPRLAAYLSAIGRQLGVPARGGMRAYLSPDGSGYDTHFDVRIAIILQIEGRKRWRFSTQPAVPCPEHPAVPDGNGGVKDARPATAHRQEWETFAPPPVERFEEVLLEPGDLLCLPAGTWHQAQAVGFSLALNLGFAPLRLHDLLLALVRNRLRTHVTWRRSVITPMLPTAGPRMLDCLVPGLEAVRHVVDALLSSPQAMETALQELSPGDTGHDVAARW
jgi:ribosomal protein L16 Arg81 hydroxylase